MTNLDSILKNRGITLPTKVHRVKAMVFPVVIYGDEMVLVVLVAKSCPTLVTPWTVAHQAPLSMGFYWQEYWSGLPFPSPRNLPDPGIEPWSPVLQADCLQTKLQGKSFDHKESWAPKNWCFWTVVLEKTLKSPLYSQEIQPVHLKGNQSWIFIGRTDAEAKSPILWPPDVKNWLIRKDLDAGKD